MRLDISFNRQAAIEAGLVVETEKRFTEEQVDYEEREALDNDTYDAGYFAWMRSTLSTVKVPNADHWVEDTGYEDVIIVRANRWGDIYYLLIDWLRENGIPWDEH